MPNSNLKKLDLLQTHFRNQGDAQRAAHNQKFFQTGPGQYGEGDSFLGIPVPVIRKFAKAHSTLGTDQVTLLIQSQMHEERLLGLLILVLQYARADDLKQQEELYQLYLSLFQWINNWDLVDTTCPHIVGKHLLNKVRSPLYTWASSELLWPRRIAIISTLTFIRQGDLDDTFALAQQMLRDPEVLIHKAVGWMLREAGKRDLRRLEAFLYTHYHSLPRTMLRYAIEKFPSQKRKQLLQGKF